MYHFGKADWEKVRVSASEISEKIIALHRAGEDVSRLWDCFKHNLQVTKEDHIPSDQHSNRHRLPWLNCRLCRVNQKKKRFYGQEDWGLEQLLFHPERVQTLVQKSRIDMYQ